MTMIIILCLLVVKLYLKQLSLFCLVFFLFFFQMMLVEYKEGRGMPQSEETTSVAHLEDKQDLSHSSGCLACVCIHNLTLPIQSDSKLVVTNALSHN